MNLTHRLSVLTGLALLGALSACGNDAAPTGTTYDVKAGDTTCDVSKTDLPAGKTTFKVENTGKDVTEVYLYGKDGDAFTKIMGEKENIGPGTSQEFAVNLAAGDYQVACKPGMTGNGIRTDITVTGSGGSSAKSQDSYDREMEFEVEAGGTVKPPADLTATMGEKIEFKLENHGTAEHYLELLDAEGNDVDKAEAQAGADGEFVADLVDAGSYTVKVFEDGKESAGSTFTLAVSR